MGSKVLILIILVVCFSPVKAQLDDPADFQWGNGFYYNLNAGESIIFRNTEVTLLKTENHYNQIKVGADTLWLKVARRSVPLEAGGIRIFVADNVNVKALTTDSLVHGLLTGDALVCLSNALLPLLEAGSYVFPVSFNEGFLWSAEEENYMFALYNRDETGKTQNYSTFGGMEIDLRADRHWLVAPENSRVVWIENEEPVHEGSAVSVLLESESQPGIYYCYSGLGSRNLAVRKGQKTGKGDAIGTAGDETTRKHFRFTVMHANHPPSPGECTHYAVNGFPQLFCLYFGDFSYTGRSFTRGVISFGKPRRNNVNQKNSMAFENYSGRGWVLGPWCIADKVEWVADENEGNVRLKKVLFENTPAQCINPNEYFEYQISVSNGTYRIRAEVGDLFQPSSQKTEFNGIPAGTRELRAGQFDWTNERAIEVQNGKITVRIYPGKENERVAGLSQIVFQRTY